MEFQDQQRSPLIWAAPRRIPRKPVLTSSPNERRDFTSESSNWKSPEYTYHPIQTPENHGGHPFYSAPPLCKPPSQQPVGRWGLLPGGWRGGCTLYAIITIVVLLINFCLTLWAFLGHGGEDGVGTIFEGNCNQAKRLSLVVHLFINALGTILLSASNYTMQCLSAPTRAEVDKAHARKMWLDIGIPSVKNLGKISRVRLTLWYLLSISSIPLHFIYNSAVFSTVPSYNYRFMTITEDNLPINASNASIYNKLDNRECMKAYGVQFIFDRQDVLVVVSGNGWRGIPKNRYIELGGSSRSFDWICNSFNITTHPSCNLGEALDRADSWVMDGSAVQYCLSEKMPEICRLQYSLYIMIAVIVCNAVKVACMFLAAFGGKSDPLVTVGDAITSFLGTPDETTIGMCIVSKREINNGIWKPKNAGATQGPHVWELHRSFWFSAASISRWLTCNFLSLVGIITAAMFYTIGISDLNRKGIPHDLPSLSKLGFGDIDVRLMANPLYSNGDLISCILTANLPRAIFSFLYLLYNSIFTCMLLGDEWDRFSYQQRSLRVTKPVGAQRSTYFLQLPYKYSLPLMIGSGLMHWLISQSIFLARILTVEGPLSVELTSTHSMIGWSPSAIIIALTLASIMLATAIVNGFRRYGGGIPLVGSCSAAIIAACHPDPQEPLIATLPIMWGVMSKNGGVGHCSFSDKDVVIPVPGQHYAGTSMGHGINLDGWAMRDRGRCREY